MATEAKNLLVASHPISVDTRAVAPENSSVWVRRPALKYDFAALDGLKVVACTGVLVFHALMYWGTLLDLDRGYQILDKYNSFRMALYTPPIGMDVFFVLTGMWAAWSLVPSLESVERGGSWALIRRYYKRRIVRVLPPYLTTLALVALAVNHTPGAEPALRKNHDVVFEYCPTTLFLNFILANNIVGFGGCGVHFWTLTIQIQFYIVFPLLLWWAAPRLPNYRKRVSLGAVAALMLCFAYRWAAASAVDVHMPLPAYTHPDLSQADGDAAVRYYDTLYFSTVARIGNLATGVLIGLALATETWGIVLARHRRALAVSCGVVVAIFCRIVIAKKLYGPPADRHLWTWPREFAALAYHGSPLYCITVGLVVLAIALRAGPFGAFVAQFLSSRPFRHLSRVSFHIYLLHMPALYWWEKFMLPPNLLGSTVNADPVRGYLIIFGGLALSSYIVGLAHCVLHEVLLGEGRSQPKKGARATR